MKRNSQPSATIDHYKMFKDGKHWVYAGITIAGLGSTLMLTTNALADTTTPVSATTTASAPNTTTSDQLSQAAGVTAADSSSDTNSTAGTDTNSKTATVSSEASTSNTTVADTTTAAADTTTTDADADAANNTSVTDTAATTDSANDTTGQTNTDTTSASTSTDSTKSTTTADAASDQASATLDSTESTADTTDTVTDADNQTVDTNATSTDAAAKTTSNATDNATTDNTATSTTTAAATTDDATTVENAATDTAATTTAATPATTSLTTTDDGHGLIYETDDQTGNQKSTITIEQTGPYSVTWKKVTTSNKDETTTVTLDASDIVKIVDEIKDLTSQAATPAGQEKLAAAKAKLSTIVDQLKELPTDIASTIVGNLIYPIVFTGSGSEALSNLRTEMNEHRYDISNTWEGLDPVAYATDRAAAEEYYPAAVTWWNNVTKETWTLPEYNDPTQNVRAYYIQNGDSTKTVIIGQGWTEHLDWIGYVSKIWYDMGYNILMPSQRGQFLSDGDDLTFGYQDKYDWLNWVKMVDERNGANSEVVFYGQSLGADTVLEAASVPGLSKSVKAVVADAGYATLPELGASLYTKAINYVSNALQSVGLPAITSLPFLSYDKIVAAINARLIKTQGFSVDDLSAVDAASKVTIPLLLIHTEDDAFIPYTQSLELAAANHSADQEVWILPGQVGGHAAANNAILQYQQHLRDFLAPLVSVAEAEDEAVDVDPSADSTETSNSTNSTTNNTDTTVDTDGKTSTTETTDKTAGSTDTTEATNNADNSSTNSTNSAKNSASATGSAKSADDSTSADDSSQTDLDTTTTDDNQDDATVTADGSTSATVKNGRLATVTTTDESATDTVSLADATPEDVDITDDQTSEAEITATDTAVTNNDWLVNHDHSGSVVTASLREDLSAADAMIAMAPTAVSTTKPEADSDLVPVSSPTAKSATALPQTDETSQSWLTALGASLLAVVTGLWTRIRRRFA
ncbi:cell surface hydrolase, LPXTG-anchored [Lactiplantibacillus pentosus KCA1]|nr:alpha/beta hydrolase [Lactiplantibacillus pentosus]EIW14473.1 cell surface hydrolase, LPXTG-anchored [Lactiplantibacillus pentosus KCA1]